jgi:hypothetical protein
VASIIFNTAIGPTAVKEPRSKFNQGLVPLQNQKSQLATPPSKNYVAAAIESEARQEIIGAGGREEALLEEAQRQEAQQRHRDQECHRCGKGHSCHRYEAVMDSIANLDPRQPHLTGPLYRRKNSTVFDPSQILNKSDFFFEPAVQMPFPVNDCVPYSINQSIAVPHLHHSGAGAPTGVAEAEEEQGPDRQPQDRRTATR